MLAEKNGYKKMPLPFRERHFPFGGIHAPTGSGVNAVIVFSAFVVPDYVTVVGFPIEIPSVGLGSGGAVDGAFLQPWNAQVPMLVTLVGMVMLVRPVQL